MGLHSGTVFGWEILCTMDILTKWLETAHIVRRVTRMYRGLQLNERGRRGMSKAWYQGGREGKNFSSYRIVQFLLYKILYKS